MSAYFTKHNDNFEAANLLRGENLLAPACHSYYYSIILLSKHIIHMVFGKNEKTFHEEFRRYKRMGDEDIRSSHDHIRSEMHNQLLEINQDLALRFHDEFSFLRRIRNIADYQNMLIEENEVDEVSDSSDYLRDRLIEQFNLNL